MGLFLKRLSSAQKAELRDFTGTLHTLYRQCEQGFSNMLNGTSDLMAICDQAMQEDRDLGPSEFLLESTVVGFGMRKTTQHVRKVPEVTIDMTSLIESSKEALDAYSSLLKDMHANVLSLKPANWYPKKYKKVCNSWDLYFKLRLQFLETAIGVLQPPEPLKHDPTHGNDKLNLFVYALNSIAVFSREISLPKDLGL